jgi:hypothetical protein
MTCCVCGHIKGPGELWTHPAVSATGRALGYDLHIHGGHRMSTIFAARLIPHLVRLREVAGK